jgi:hypothetical protein
MYAMKVDNAEYALLTAIVIFSGNAIITVSALYCACSWKFVELSLFKAFTVLQGWLFAEYYKNVNIKVC